MNKLQRRLYEANRRDHNPDCNHDSEKICSHQNRDPLTFDPTSEVDCNLDKNSDPVKMCCVNAPRIPIEILYACAVDASSCYCSVFRLRNNAY